MSRSAGLIILDREGKAGQKINTCSNVFGNELWKKSLKPTHEKEGKVKKTGIILMGHKAGVLLRNAGNGIGTEGYLDSGEVQSTKEPIRRKNPVSKK